MKIIHGKRGVFAEFETKLFRGLRRIEYDPTGEDIDEHIQSKVGKIPLKIYSLAVALIQKLCEMFNTEVMITINYSEKNGWYINIPKQTVTAASVDFQLDPAEYDEIFMEIHTHPGHGGYTNFSSIDKADQVKMRFYAVMGSVTCENPFRNKVSFADLVEFSPDEQKQLNELLELAKQRINRNTYTAYSLHSLYDSAYEPWAKKPEEKEDKESEEDKELEKLIRKYLPDIPYYATEDVIYCLKNCYYHAWSVDDTIDEISEAISPHRINRNELKKLINRANNYLKKALYKDDSI